MKQLKVETRSVLNVRNVELLYLVVSNGEKEIIMNVGKKTYDGIREMLEEKEVPRETGEPIEGKTKISEDVFDMEKPLKMELNEKQKKIIGLMEKINIEEEKEEELMRKSIKAK